jgi:hypothetical protein
MHTVCPRCSHVAPIKPKSKPCDGCGYFGALYLYETPELAAAAAHRRKKYVSKPVGGSSNPD